MDTVITVNTSDRIKRCGVCGQVKPITEFHKDKYSSDGHNYVCKICKRKYNSRSHKKMRRTLEGKLRLTFSKLMERATGKYEGYEHVTCNFTKEEFINKFINDPVYINLFNNWKASGFQYPITPSIDRIDSSKNYTLDNIQFITHRDNSTKDKKKATNTYTGVSYNQKNCNWIAHMSFKNKNLYIGRFSTELEAAMAVDQECIKLGIPQKNNLIKI